MQTLRRISRLYTDALHACVWHFSAVLSVVDFAWFSVWLFRFFFVFVYSTKPMDGMGYIDSSFISRRFLCVLVLLLHTHTHITHCMCSIHSYIVIAWFYKNKFSALNWQSECYRVWEEEMLRHLIFEFYFSHVYGIIIAGLSFPLLCRSQCWKGNAFTNLQIELHCTQWQICWELQFSQTIQPVIAGKHINMILHLIYYFF